MYRVALTGLIGAGKSTIVEVFKAIGIECYNSDLQAKLLMTTSLRNNIEKLLGRESFMKNGTLNRKYIANKIFSNEHLRLALNKIVHPAVKEDFIRWSNLQNSPYVIIETAILEESGLLDITDKSIVVTACEEERIKRTILRDKTTEECVRKRISAQQNQDKLLKIADYIINNDETSLIIPQILEIHKIILPLRTNK